MSKIKEILAELRPYVSGVRYVETIPIIDVTFKEGWRVPPSKLIGFERGKENKNYYMFYSDKEDIGFDEILDYIRSVITINIERELKHKLLIEKVDELKILFKENSLSKLKDLNFAFGKEKLVSDVMNEDDFMATEFDLSDDPVNEEVPKKTIQQKGKTPSVKVQEIKHNDKRSNTSSDTDSINPNEPQYVKEIEGEFQKFNISDTIELPPKPGQKIELEEFEPIGGVCTCGPDEICPICAESKAF